MTIVTVVVTALVALSGAVLSWYKLLRKPTLEKTAIYQAVRGNNQIDIIMHDLMNRIGSRVVKVGLIETTNGGGIPMAGHMTYKRVVACTDPAVFSIFGEKTPNDSTYNAIIFRCLANGETHWDVGEMLDKAVIDLFSVTNVKGGYLVMLAIEHGKRLIALAVDFNDNSETTAVERDMIRQAKVRIQATLAQNTNIMIY